MFKPSKNPLVIELTKTCTKRQFAVGGLKWVIREDGSKGCIWCGDPLKTKHRATRYCKDPMCPKSTYAWGYPQKEEGLQFLLIRQDYKCALCQYDYMPFIESYLRGKYYGCKKIDYDEINHYFMKRLKRHIPKDRRPEVDHVIPIYKGGQSLGLDNHQVICYTCHKIKTKVDVAGPRKSLKKDT